MLFYIFLIVRECDQIHQCVPIAQHLSDFTTLSIALRLDHEYIFSFKKLLGPVLVMACSFKLLLNSPPLRGSHVKQYESVAFILLIYSHFHKQNM